MLVEIPEHLLKRSRERRAALGLGGGDAPSEGAGGSAASEAPAATPAKAAATPAPAAAAPVEEAKPEPPKPVPAYIQAAQRRRRIPFWATPVLAALPLWGYVFVQTLSPAPVEDDPLTLGQEIYSTAGCSGCHGGTGGGNGAIPQLSDGKVLETWEDYRDQMMWVRLGTDGWPAPTYGAQDKPVGGGGTMPSHPQLTDEELAQVVLYERRGLSGEEAPENVADDTLLAIASGEMTFAEAGLGPLSEAAGVPESDLEAGG